MLHSQAQVKELFDKIRYCNFEVQSPGEKPISVGIVAMEMYKIIQEKDAQIEDLRKQIVLRDLALGKYSKDEKDDMLADMKNIIAHIVDLREVKTDNPLLQDILKRETGTCQHPGYVQYEGEIIGGVPYGKGTATLKDGSVYTGDFRLGKFHGKGKLTYKTGAEFDGEFKRGCILGQGTYKYPDGDIYSGSMVQGRKEGLGVVRAASGDVQIGYYHNDLNHGLCVNIVKDHSHVAIENYKDDKKEGAWRLYQLRTEKKYSGDKEIAA